MYIVCRCEHAEGFWAPPPPRYMVSGSMSISVWVCRVLVCVHVYVGVLVCVQGVCVQLWHPRLGKGTELGER